jgi:hypothetical protein
MIEMNKIVFTIYIVTKLAFFFLHNYKFVMSDGMQGSKCGSNNVNT